MHLICNGSLFFLLFFVEKTFCAAPVLGIQILKCISYVLGHFLFYYLFKKIHFLSLEMCWACSGNLDTGVHLSALTHLLFYYRLLQVCVLSLIMQRSCSEHFNPGAHFIYWAAFVFSTVRKKCIFLSLEMNWACSRQFSFWQSVVKSVVGLFLLLVVKRPGKTKRFTKKKKSSTIYLMVDFVKADC